MLQINDKYRIVLASGSPRRKELLKEIVADFEIKVPNIAENFPSTLKGKEVAEFLCELKAGAFDQVASDELIITADTIVCVDELILNKPSNYEEAFKMLSLLSDRKHEVITAVCFKSADQQKTISVTTTVYFKPLRKAEIDYYIQHYQPFDKAGGYGIQEWIGYIGIDKIEGSYFNVVGFPVREVYECLSKF